MANSEDNGNRGGVGVIQCALDGSIFDANGPSVVAPFLQLFGHGGSEIAGPAFSPDGSILYFSSQRGIDGAGITFEVTGPFVW